MRRWKRKRWQAERGFLLQGTAAPQYGHLKGIKCWHKPVGPCWGSRQWNRCPLGRRLPEPACCHWDWPRGAAATQTSPGKGRGQYADRTPSGGALWLASPWPHGVLGQLQHVTERLAFTTGRLHMAVAMLAVVICADGLSAATCHKAPCVYCWSPPHGRSHVCNCDMRRWAVCCNTSQSVLRLLLVGSTRPQPCLQLWHAQTDYLLQTKQISSTTNISSRNPQPFPCSSHITDLELQFWKQSLTQ
jgi:hypothetical protein